MSSRQPIIEIRGRAVAVDEIVAVHSEGNEIAVELVGGRKIPLDEREAGRIINFVDLYDR